MIYPKSHTLEEAELVILSQNCLIPKPTHLTTIFIDNEMDRCHYNCGLYTFPSYGKSQHFRDINKWLSAIK